MITEQLLTHLGIDAADWLVPLSDACNTYEIDTEERISMFLANCLHESNVFTRLVESLNYSPGRLLAVFPKYFTPAEAVEFAHDDIRIAERVYGGRLGNGPEGLGDGYRYRGRGLLQLTGKGIYTKAQRVLGAQYVDLPDLVAQPEHAAMTAAWVWTDEKKCNALADSDKFQACVKRINGGLNGMDDRLAWLDKVKEALA